MNTKEVASFINEVFNAYTASFEDSLNRLRIWPWTDEKTVIHESNQVHRFLDAYQKTGDNIVTWTELPVYYKGGHEKPQLAHIDAFIIDQDRKLIFFIEAKRFSKKDQLDSLKADINRLYDIAKEIYVGKGDFKGLNLFEYDAYMIALADVWDYRSTWCKEFAANWKREASWIAGIYGYTLSAMINSINFPGVKKEGQYHLLAALMPVFDAEGYAMAVEEERHKLRPRSNPSILTYADEVPFEDLLAMVNKEKH